MNISSELATCVAMIKSWDVFPDQEKARTEVVATLEKLSAVQEICNQLANTHPVTTDGPCDDRLCFFCREWDTGKGIKHSEDCVWQKNSKLLFGAF